MLSQNGTSKSCLLFGICIALVVRVFSQCSAAKCEDTIVFGPGSRRVCYGTYPTRCPDGTCAPLDYVCCGNGYSCPPGHICDGSLCSLPTVSSSIAQISSSSNSLSGGGIVGIIIGSVVMLALIFFYLKTSRTVQTNRLQSQPQSNAQTNNIPSQAVLPLAAASYPGRSGSRGLLKLFRPNLYCLPLLIEVCSGWQVDGSTAAG